MSGYGTLSLGREIIIGMSTGSLAEWAKNYRVWPISLVGVIVICAVLLGTVNLSTPWTVALQIASAVAGAALGNALRLNASQNVVRNQARPATRHLFDQVSRLQKMVQRAEGYQSSIDQEQVEQNHVDLARVGDWFGTIGAGLRDEITSTATAIEAWGDLAKDVRDEEFASYQTRPQRLPIEQEGQQD